MSDDLNNQHNVHHHRKILLRDDLELIDADDGSLEIKDPNNGQFFYIGPRDSLAIKLLSQLDTEEFLNQTDYHREDLIQLIKTLKNFNLLKGIKHKQSSKKLLKKKGVNLLVFRKVLCDPDQFLASIEPKLNVLWTSPLKIFLLVIPFLALCAWTAQGNVFMNYGWPLIANNWFVSLFCFTVLLFSVLIGHELCHGLVLKYFGGSVKELGFCLIYIMPSFYSDVTDVYKLKNLHHRAMVMEAGPMFQIYVGCLAFILWTQSIPHTFISDLLYLLTFACFFSLIVNINPFLRLDGYYVLEFYLRVHDLRVRSWKYIKALIFREKQEVLSLREKTIFLLYAPISIVYTLLLISWILGFYLDSVVLAAPMSFIVLGVSMCILVLNQGKEEHEVA